VDSPTVVADLDQPPESPQEQPTSPPGLPRERPAAADLAVPPGIARDAAAMVDAALVDTALTEPQRALLDFERRWWRQGGAKEQAIRDTFGLTPTRYYQNLNSVLDLPAAAQYDPALVHRLQRLRGAATRGRRLA
jgi:hypothetical protein